LQSKGSVFKSIQVKTTSTECFDLRGLKGRQFHLVALVSLVGEGDELDLEESAVFLLTREEAQRSVTRQLESLVKWKLGHELVATLFSV
jgi:hypothetical protein